MLRLAMVQMAVSDSKAHNLRTAQRHILHAAQQGAKLIILPECFNSPYGTKHFPKYAEPIPSGETCQFLSRIAQETRTVIIGGSIPEIAIAAADSTPPSTNQPNHGDHNQSAQENIKYYNTCTVWSPTGTHIATHRKLHLFDISIPNGITFRESSILSPGSSLTLLDLTPYLSDLGLSRSAHTNNESEDESEASLKVGLGICYDLRFAEMATLMARQGAHLMVYPGAFNTITGPRHWNLLLQSRALDNQIFSIGVSPARFSPETVAKHSPPPPNTTATHHHHQDHDHQDHHDASWKQWEESEMKRRGEYIAYGHSLICAPDASILTECDELEHVRVVDLALERVRKVRQEIPVTMQRRFDVYPDIAEVYHKMVKHE